MPHVFIICNPLMDTIVPVDYPRVESLNLKVGSMNLVEFSFIEQVKGQSDIQAVTPGGSGANTARGIAWLSRHASSPMKVSYLGAVGDDAEGRELSELLAKTGVTPLLARKGGKRTGVCLVLVTPDHERTLCTYLGACRELDAGDLPILILEDADILYVTGYNWDTPNQREVVSQSASIARKKGARVCLDVADPFVVHRYRDSLLKWIPENVDILFGNREELRVLTQETEDDRVLRKAADLSPHVVMKTGKDGCLVFHKGERVAVPGFPARALDTTGAGDSFAAGYLFGSLIGWDAGRCGQLANRLAAGIVSVYGCDYSKLDGSEVLGLR